LGYTVADAVIVSTARTGLAKSWRGGFNMTHGATLAGHVIRSAVERAGVDVAEIEDVLMGCALPEGATGANIARQAARGCRSARRARPSTASVRRDCRPLRWRRNV
jgi:acetyl-CoA acetyltransferase